MDADFDDIALCYFAALIEGIRIINQKEEDLGLYPGSTPLDADALIHFVRRKGDRLVHLYQTQIRMPTATKTWIKWTDDESRQVAQKAREMFPAIEKLGGVHFFAAQEEVLPANRCKTQGSIYASKDLPNLRAIAGSVLAGSDHRVAPPAVARAAVHPPGRDGRKPVHSGNGASPRPPAPKDIDPGDVAAADSASVAQIIVAALLDMNIQALAIATDRLKELRKNG